ncbi:MAG: putative glycosyltransferase [Sphingomonadales bacterium]|nr:putative glycosyltransferase [Sphingomonadales bacterium]
MASTVLDQKPAAIAQSPLEVAIIVPTLNESGNIAAMVAALDIALAGNRYEIIFVDDWSADGTPDVVATAAAGRSDIRLVRRYGRRGLSSAVIEGALATVAPIVAVIDADMQHDESLLPRLIAAVASGSADVAIGSRYVADGSVGDWDATRARGSRVATTLSKTLLKVDVADPMSGFFAIRRDLVIAALPKLSSMGFKILLDLLVSAPQPLKIVELPFTFRTRNAGTSKLDSSVAVDFALMLADKSIGRWIPARLLMFAIVGAVGLLVHLSLLRIGLAVGASFSMSMAVAVVGAISFNFVLNNSLTYRDRRLRGAAWLWGLISFYAVCGIGAVANVGVGSIAFNSHYSWWLAGVAGAAVGSVWNFAASSVLTWRKR